MTDSASGVLKQLPMSSLLLDWSNPRLPPSMQVPDITQAQLATFINKHYDPLRIAESIASHEFFQSEPLIAVLEDSRYRVIEGNRRLTALMGLADPELRELFARENKGWKRLDGSVPPKTVPVLVVEDERSVAPLLGYRHISGIEPWDPYAQARYIARLVNENESLERVAELVGRDLTEVRSMYRDHEILQQADEMFRIDTARARAAFGVFTNALGRRAIQSFIGATPPRFVKTTEYPLPADRGDELRELLFWVFGGTRGDGRVITDSRQLGELARVLAKPDATETLRKTNSLVDALDSLVDPDEQFSRSSARVLRELEKILDSEVSLPVSHVAEFVSSAREALDKIEESLGGDA